VLLLSALPCADDDTASASPATIGIVKNGSEEQDHHTEQCTPFCICACCHFPVNAIQQNTATNTFSPSLIEHATAYHSSAYSAVYFDFWQPPRA
jgi:hypothetical protein